MSLNIFKYIKKNTFKIHYTTIHNTFDILYI